MGESDLKDVIGTDQQELTLRQGMADADAAYRQAKASGKGVDEASARLRNATLAWERRFVIVADADRDDPAIVQDADAAWQALEGQLKVAENAELRLGESAPAFPEMTDAETMATFLFPGVETLTEKEGIEDARPAREAREKERTDARRKLDETRKNKDRVFAELRDHYNIATALDREAYLEPGGDVGAPPPFGWEKPPDGGPPYPFGWNILKPSAPKLVVAGVTIGVIVIGGAILFVGGGSSDSKSADTGARAVAVQGDAFSATRAAETAIAGASTPGGPALSGNYLETISVEKDPAGHMKYVAMPPQILVSVFIVRDKSTGAITLTFNGPPPWVNVAGTAQFGQGFNSSGGTFDATGQGEVAGRQGVGVDLSGSIMAGGELQGSLTMGTNGVLPTGQSITYHVEGKRQ